MNLMAGAVLEKTREIQYLLRVNFGANGKELHECVDNLAGALPPDLLKNISYIATVQEKLLHDRGYQYDGDEGDFWWLCDTVISKLSHYYEVALEEAAATASPPRVPVMAPAPVVSRKKPLVRWPAIERRFSVAPRDRSFWFRLALFLFLPPVWAVWMLLDRDQGFLIKAIAAIVFLVFSIAGLTAYSLFVSPDTSGAGRTPVVIRRAATPVPVIDAATFQATAAPSVPVPASPVPATATPASSPAARAAVCVVEWHEHGGDVLADKNRNQVWNAIVKTQIEGSEITAAKFYDLVVEQNPVLKTDGYVFKRGKTYLLPECK